MPTIPGPWDQARRRAILRRPSWVACPRARSARSTPDGKFVRRFRSVSAVVCGGSQRQCGQQQQQGSSAAGDAEQDRRLSAAMGAPRHAFRRARMLRSGARVLARRGLGAGPWSRAMRPRTTAGGIAARVGRRSEGGRASSAALGASVRAASSVGAEDRDDEARPRGLVARLLHPFSREASVAPQDFNRWLVVPGSFLVQLSIGR